MIRAARRPALRYHGGKFRMATWIHQFFPPHQVYVEPFGGSAAVLLLKERSYAEVYNDLDEEVVNFFRVLREPDTAERFRIACALTPFSRLEHERAQIPATDPVERARRLAVRAWMGYASSGATKKNTGFRIDTGRKRSTDFCQWDRYPAEVQWIHARLQGVLIECRPATSVMMQHDAPSTLHYVDPPYVMSTRASARLGENSYYRHEMTDWQHMDLLSCLKNLRGFVVLSGYDSPMYYEHLREWTIHTKQSRGNARRGSKINTEFLWLNPRCTL